jgi:hypothetical protein
MLVRLYPDKYHPVPANRAVILARLAHAGFGKAKVKARSKIKNYFGKVFDQTFFKKFVGCGAKPHDLHPYAHSSDYVPPLRGGGV